MSSPLNIFNVYKKLSLLENRYSLNTIQTIKSRINLDDSKLHTKIRFNEFKTRFNKIYKSDNHHDNAYKTFCQSDKLIQLINSLKLPYSLGHNHYSDYTYNEFIDTFTGLKNISKKNNEQNKINSSDSSDKDNVTIQTIQLDGCNEKNSDGCCYNSTVLDLQTKASLKENFDKMQNASQFNKIDWRYFLPNIKNQDDCGACWAFSSIVSVEGLYNIDSFLNNNNNNNKYKEDETIKWNDLLNDIKNKDKDLMLLFKESGNKSLTQNDCTNNNKNLLKYKQNISLSEQYIIDCAKYPTVISDICDNWGGCSGGTQVDCYNTIKNCGIVPYDKYNVVLKDDKKNITLTENYIGSTPFSDVSVLTDDDNYCNDDSDGGNGDGGGGGDGGNGDGDGGNGDGGSDIIDPENLDPKDYLKCIQCENDTKKVLQASKVPTKCKNIKCDEDKDSPCRIFINDYQRLGLKSKNNCDDLEPDLEIALIKAIEKSPVAVSIYVTPVLRFYKCGIYNQYQDPTSCLQMYIAENIKEDKLGVDIQPSKVNHGVSVVGYEVMNNSDDISQSDSKSYDEDTIIQYDPTLVDPQADFEISKNDPTASPQYTLDGNNKIISQLDDIINLNLPHYLSEGVSYKLSKDPDSPFNKNLKKQLDYYTSFKEKIQTKEIVNAVYTIRNSWDDSWGENGYFRMQAGINNLQVTDQVYTCSNVSTTPPDNYDSICNFNKADLNEDQHCI